MTQRRRFFPSSPVQKVPGKTAEFGMQLQPLAKVPAQEPPTGISNLFGAGWLVPTLSDYSGYLTSAQLPDGRYEIKDVYGDGLESSIWEGVPVVVDADYVVHPVSGPGFHCTELQLDTTYWVEWPGRTFFGVLQGTDMSAVRWEIAWDAPSEGNPAVSRQGHYAETYGNVVQVRASNTDGSLEMIDTLTARAFSGGQQVALLIFRGHARAF